MSAALSCTMPEDEVDFDRESTVKRSNAMLRSRESVVSSEKSSDGLLVSDGTYSEPECGLSSLSDKNSSMELEGDETVSLLMLPLKLGFIEKDTRGYRVPSFVHSRRGPNSEQVLLDVSV